jgi:predicted GIY-YIG superfamily endonuclease
MYVYLLRSVTNPKKTYVGSSLDPKGRLAQHNAGDSPYTARFRPWQRVVIVEFLSEDKARTFERYLKSGSGHAFARRHFW